LFWSQVHFDEVCIELGDCIFKSTDAFWKRMDNTIT
jgi:hypothetical protein